MRRLSLRQNFSWTIAGNVTYAGCQWGMLVVLAKLGSPEMVGQFALGLAVTAPVIIFSEMALRQVQATDAKSEYLFGQYFALRLFTTALSLLVIMAIALISGYQFEAKLVILVVGLAKACEAISDIIYGLLQQHERMDRIAISMMIKGPLSLMTFAVGVYLTGTVVWGAVGLAIAWLILLATYDLASVSLILKATHPVTQILNFGKLGVPRPSWDKKKLLRLAWLTLPLAFVMLINSLKGNIPRYFIEGYLGAKELGFFAAMAYLMVAGQMINNALGNSASPRLAKYYAAGQGDKYGGLLLKLTLIGGLVGAAGVLLVLLAGKEILTLIYTSEFGQHAQVLTWIMIGSGIRFAGGFLGYGITAARYFRIQVPLNIIGLIAVITGSFLLVPRYGLLGAAWAVAGAFLSDVILKSLVVVHALKNIRVKS